MRRVLIGIVLAVMMALMGSGVAPAGLNAVPSPALACDNSALIAAIETANATPGADTIALDPGCVYSFIAPYSPAVPSAFSYWYGPSALPAIASDITIEGNGATIERSVSATVPFRLFFVGADPDDPDTFGYTTPGPGVLTLSDVTLKGGLAAGGDSSGGGGGAGLGGAIFSQGQVTLLRVAMVNNIARGGSGGVGGNGHGGGGVGANAPLSGLGAGFGAGFTFASGSSGGAAATGGGGGGGFRSSENGAPGVSTSGGSGGGPASGLAGSGGGALGGSGGNGGGGGGDGTILAGGAGGGFGFGGSPGNPLPAGSGGGGGGVGGGGGTGANGGGGGFGGGGGSGSSNAGKGGFGGGGGGGGVAASGGFGAGGGSAFGGGGGAGLGGAIFNHQGELTIRNSTLSGNSAIGGTGAQNAQGGQGLGGAIFNLNGSTTVDSSTIAKNTALVGGALYNLGYLADDTGDAPGHTYIAATVLANSILADSTTGVVDAVDVVANAPVTTAGGMSNTAASTVNATLANLIESQLQVDNGTISGTPITTDPALAALAQGAGDLTPTHAIQNTSPAFDVGDTTLTTDQRGVTRPQGNGDDIGAFELEVTKATPTLTTLASSNVVLGGSVSDTATLSGGSSPTGTVTFTLYGPNDADCSGTPAFASAPIALSSGTASSGSFTPTATGTYRWKAAYSGDGSNNPVTSSCDDPAEDVTVLAANHTPNCSAVTATPVELQPNGKMIQVSLGGATDADGDPLTYTIDAVTQDEPVTGPKGDKTFPDAAGAIGNTVSVRAENNAKGNGRVYRIAFTVSDGTATCSRTAGPTGTTTAKVSVPVRKGKSAFDDGTLGSWNSSTGAQVP